MPSKSKKECIERYHKAYTQTVLLRLFERTEQDIITKLENVENKNGYIKALIRADIEKNGL